MILKIGLTAMKRLGKKRYKGKGARIVCDEKISFYTSKDANEAARKAERKYGERNYAYRCLYCKKWHLTRQKD